MVQFLQSERLADRLGELLVPHLLVRLPWATHHFDLTCVVRVGS